jgi:hypothetical protein
LAKVEVGEVAYFWLCTYTKTTEDDIMNTAIA